MTAPDLPTWTVEEDADGDETLWYGDTAVLRRFELNAHKLFQSGTQEHRDLLWQVLTAVLAPDEATIERLAEAGATGEGMDWARTMDAGKEYFRANVRAVLAALAGTSAQARHTSDDATGGGAS